ncbi:MAG: DUF5716 family protein [Treponema sp.]|nr:DUF5716 family protein [Treponema sp.]
MNLFERIPENFFSILSSKNKELYVDALMLLHRSFQYELNIETSDFIAELIGLLDTRTYELEEDDEEIEGSPTLSIKARLVLNRFVITGWVDRETMDGSFTEVITPRDYAIQVMKLLHDLGDAQLREYNSLVFSTYSSLKEAYHNQQNQMYEAILNARSNTEKLTYELRTLYHGIRNYLRKIQGLDDVNLLLRDHFDEYKALTDQIYHPIKTMDSVHRYRTPIMEILSETLGNYEILDGMRKRAMAIRKYQSEDEAGREIINAINYIIDVYQSIGEIISEIDKKHSTYTKRSIDTIRYHLAADQTIGGKLALILKTYAGSSGAREEKILGLMEKGVSVNRQEFFDGHSLWHRNAKRLRLPVEPLATAADTGLPQADAEKLGFLNNEYSMVKIMEFMDKLFGERDIITTDEIEIDNDNEFIKILLATIRAGERNSIFKVQFGTGRRETNGYKIPELNFSRKGRRK